MIIIMEADDQAHIENHTEREIYINKITALNHLHMDFK